MHGPWCGVFDEQLMPFTLLPLKPVVDCAGRNRCGQRPKVAWRRAGDGRELAEAPVGQVGGATRRLANNEVVGVVRLGPELAGLGGALFDAGASCAGRFVERVNAGVPFIGWARGPFPVSGVRSDSGHTTPSHMVLLATGPEGVRWKQLQVGRRGGVARTATAKIFAG